MRLPSRAAVFAFAVVVALGGCGGQSGDGMSSAAQAELVPLVQQVRRAAGSRDVQGVQRGLAELQHAVAQYGDRGDISATRAAEILDAAAQVQRRLASVPTPTITTSTTTTTTTTPADRGRGNKNKHDKGNRDNEGGGDD